ncbi:MAG: nucleotidyltransferase domain-containing protein [Lachnospiraceae bacterium]|nr:nucleotidyltransferase domain-containing protein [Lachnospiraceae bacterium]
MCELSRVKTNFETEVSIAEIKIKYVENIIKTAPMCQSIAEIVLFGSVLEGRCTENSDIDLLIVSEKQKSRLFRDRSYINFKNKIFIDGNFKQDYDFIYMNCNEDIDRKSFSSSLFQNIKEYGQTIYRRMNYGGLPESGECGFSDSVEFEDLCG